MERTELGKLEAVLNKIRIICRYDLFFFAKYVLNYDLLVEEIHTPFCYFLTDSFIDYLSAVQNVRYPNKIFHPQSKRLRKKLLLAPRESYKSTLVSKALPLFILKEFPNWSILISSEIKDNAKLFLYEIKKQLETNPLFRALYGDWVSPKWSEEQIVISKRTKHTSTPSISVSGTTSVTTSQHFDVIILDDPHSFANTSSLEAIEKVKQYWRELDAQLKKGGFFYIVGTFYHKADLYNHIIENFSDEYDILIQGVYNKDGSLWWKEKFSEEFLKEKAGVTRREFEIFSCFYLLNPVPITERKIDITKIQFWEGKLPNLNLFCIIDPAISQKKYASNSAIVIMGMDEKRNAYLIEYKLGRFKPKELLENSILLIRKYEKLLKKVAPEAESGFEFFVSMLEERLREEGINVIVEPLKSRGLSKEARITKIDGLAMAIDEKKFFIHKTHHEFLKEAEFFPKGISFDLLDACAYFFDIAYPPISSSNKKASTETDYWLQKINKMDDELLKPKPIIHPVFGRIK